MQPDTHDSKKTMPFQGTRVVVAMSGGVDSSVAALLLAQQGYDVVGVSMQVWDYRNNGGCKSRATCCAPDDFSDARKVAAMVGVPYYVFDLEQIFREQVIDRFVSTYKSGATPNPCVDCNSKVKFRELRDRATSMGVPFVATGHYAQVRHDADGSHLLRGSDSAKDQSYFLYGCARSELASTIFPVGAMTKQEVREIARHHGLTTADKPESQDICFVSDTAKDFVTRIGGRGLSGAVRTRNGKILGSHAGLHRFTVGQRRGLGVADSLSGDDGPHYVVELDPKTNSVIVGPRTELERTEFEVGEINWLIDPPQTPIDITVQVRHRHSGVAARLFPNGLDRARIEFTDQWAVVSPGQAAVFYDPANIEVLGGGRISPVSVHGGW